MALKSRGFRKERFDIETQQEYPCEDGDREWSYAKELHGFPAAFRSQERDVFSLKAAGRSQLY